MKKLLIVALALSFVPAFAKDEPAAKDAPAAKETPKEAPAAKPQEKEKPRRTPKPVARKPGQKAEFEAYDGGPWRPVDNRKGHLLGYQIKDADLFMQPVLVVKCDPAVAVEYKVKEDNTEQKYILNFLGWEAKEQPRLQVINVPSRELTSDEEKSLAKLAGKSAGVSGYPWYKNFGLEKEPENPKGEYPFYYVVGIDGKVWYAGPKGVKAQRIVFEQMRKGGTPDPMLGFYKPTIHTAITEKIKFGESIAKAVQKLTPLAKAKGESDSKTEAVAILNELDQSQTYWLKQTMLIAGGNPPQGLLLAAQASKTFPRSKDFKPIVDKIKSNPTVAPVIQTFTKIAEIQEKMKAAADKGEELKKSDVKKWYPIVCNGEKKVNSAKKSFGDKLPRAFFCLEDLVLTVKAELEAAGAGEK